MVNEAEGAPNEAKEDFGEENNYPDDSGGDKDPLGIPKYGLPDEPSKFIFFAMLPKIECIIMFIKIFPP